MLAFPCRLQTLMANPAAGYPAEKNHNPMSEKQIMVVAAPKNVGVAIILTILFGPLGLFYATVRGGVWMTILSLIIGAITLGLGLLITWPASIVWGVIATNNYNKQLLSGTN